MEASTGVAALTFQTLGVGSPERTEGFDLNVLFRMEMEAILLFPAVAELVCLGSSHRLWTLKLRSACLNQNVGPLSLSLTPGSRRKGGERVVYVVPLGPLSLLECD